MLELTGLSFPYEIKENLFREVEYENAVQKNVTVTRATGGGEGGTNSSVPKPEGSTGKPSGKGEVTKIPKTGDESFVGLWSILGMTALAGAMWGLGRKREKHS